MLLVLLRLVAVVGLGGVVAVGGLAVVVVVGQIVAQAEDGDGLGLRQALVVGAELLAQLLKR